MVAESLFTIKKEWVENNMVCLLMSDNKEIRFPVEANKKLKNATDKQRNNIEIICGNTGLHWPDLDEAISVTGITEGKCGN